jgi:RND family efflux transporter MFP subunit
MDFRFRSVPMLAMAVALACGEVPAAESSTDVTTADVGTTLVLRDTLLTEVTEVSAVAEPLVTATLATKVMGQVLTVLPREGESVPVGAVLVRLDARDIAARREQAQAAMRGAEAALQDAARHAARIRALHADSAAAKAQLDAAETGLARAEQAALGARAAVTEVDVLADYANVRAPFRGVVVRRFVDAGAFVTPGMPLLQIEDASTLRVVAAVAPLVARSLRRGTSVRVSIEGVDATGVVEGIVPVAGASLSNVQVLVDNARQRFSSGSAASLSLTGGTRTALLVPTKALVRSGDLAGVRMRSAGTTVTRWVRLGREHDGFTEILSGLVSGDTIVVPTVPVKGA